jgi:SAM-dependent methyltransferase
MSTFDYYAAYYDLLYKDKDYAGEIEYLQNLITTHSDFPKTLLNLGCGTGKHDFLLAAKGYRVTGIDVSEKMITNANQNKSVLDGSLDFILGDIRTIRLNQTFDVITSLFHVINYQTTNQDLIGTFETVKIHLNPGGLFIFDSWYGPGVLTEQPERRVKEIENELISVVRLAEPVLHYAQNLVEVNYTLQIKDKAQKINQDFKEQHRMRYLFYPEIEMITQFLGFEIIRFETWMDGGTPENNWYVTFVCRLKYAQLNRK